MMTVEKTRNNLQSIFWYSFRFVL